MSARDPAPTEVQAPAGAERLLDRALGALRTRAALSVLWAGTLPSFLPAQDLHPQVRTLLEPHGLARFPPLQRRALDTFVRVEEALARRDVDASARLLESLWRQHPPGSGDWLRFPTGTAGLNVGSPPCYYALRMLSDIVAWRQQGRPTEPALPLVLTVVLVGRSSGVQPSSVRELAAGTGRAVAHLLHPALLDRGSHLVHESLALFAAYVEAITAGRAVLRAAVVPLPDLELPVVTVAEPRRHAGLAGDALARVWAALPAPTIAATDWWWVIYPSHVPEQHADFARTEFVTGGMAVGPDGAAPCFLVDDLWLVRKPPHLGRGEYSDLERRAYLPQWLQHEFFHHLFRSWPEFELEKASHQWFDRKTWPSDFTGSIEPDYYAEALHKRLHTRADPPLHAKLRHAAPSRSVLARLRVRDLEGTYARTPRENDWHEGRIESAGRQLDDGRLVLRWTNAAGRSWTLHFRRGSASLETGRDNPYADQAATRAFRLVLARDRRGEYLPEVIGFRFGGELYARQPR